MAKTPTDRPPRKLELHRQTLRRLDTRSLERAVGAAFVGERAIKSRGTTA